MLGMDAPQKSTPAIGWILYDGSCGVCRTGVQGRKELLRRNGFEIRAIQDPWVQEHVSVSSDELLRDLQLILNDGRRLAGSDAYRFVMRRIWWAYPFYLLSILPGLSAIFNWAYRTFANNRHKISQACRVD